MSSGRDWTHPARPEDSSICKSLVFLSPFFFFPFPSKQNCLAAALASVPEAVPKGPSHPAEVMAVILLMGGKMDGTRCPKRTREAVESAAPGEGMRCWNTPSFGALLGLERAAILAKTCFCQQKPHFTNIQQQQQKNRKWEENPEDYAPPLHRAGELKSLASSTPGLNKWA